MIIFSFLFFTGLVAVLTYCLTRHDDHGSSKGYFLGGRSLGGVVIAGSLLLTNLSTEQLVGLNGAAFHDGLAVMVWEVVAVIALVAMALFFLPRYLKGGITTVPQFLEDRFDHGTQTITTFIFLVAYVGILLPIILYTGARGLSEMLDVQAITGLSSETAVLWFTIWLVGIIGSVYAIFGGLRTVAVSDTLNGVGLLVGGLMITFFGLQAISGGEGVLRGMELLGEVHPEKLNSIAGPEQSVPFSTIFTGILLLNVFYFCTNQQIIQRTFGARSLKEGQKGVLYMATLKLLGPLYLVLPGIMAYYLFADQGVAADKAYGQLVRHVLPAPLTGFFAAAMVGAILSSFNSALNASCTLFSLGVYKNLINKNASDHQLVQSGKTFGWVIAIIAMIIAPLLANTASIFVYLQKMNGLYAIPIFAVVLVGMLTRRVPAIAAKIALVVGFTVIALGYFVPTLEVYVTRMHQFHFFGAVFLLLVIIMLVIGKLKPSTESWQQADSGEVELTPWSLAKPLSVGLIIAVFLIYGLFADFSVLGW